MNKAIHVTAGCLLGLLSVAGTIRATNATRSYVAYHRAKYGCSKGNSREVFQLAERADRLYPSNYYLCILASELAYHTYDALDEPERSRRLSAAQFWCDRGLRKNPYKSQLRLLEARLAARESPARAARLWAEYVDWEFWVPHHHAVLVEFLVEAGEFGRAVEELKWTRNSGHHDAAKRAIDEAWRREMSPPPG